MAKKAVFRESKYYKDEHDEASKAITKSYTTLVTTVAVIFIVLFCIFRLSHWLTTSEMNTSVRKRLTYNGYTYKKVKVGGVSSGTSSKHRNGIPHKVYIWGLEKDGVYYKRARAIYEVNDATRINSFYGIEEVKDYESW